MIELPVEGMVTFAQIKELLPFSSTRTLYRRIKAGTFPEGRIEGNRRCWEVSEIRDYFKGGYSNND